MLATLDLVRPFEGDPDLLEGIDPAVAEHLRRRLTVRRVCLGPGPWQPQVATARTPGALGLLVLEGLLVRTIELGGRLGSEVLGPGDLLPPGHVGDSSASQPCPERWVVLERTVLADLDRSFAEQVARWPSVGAALLSRAERRCRSLVFQATVAQVRHADTRVLLMLWNLADRWGRVTADGVVVPVPLTHRVLAQLTCLQRPTVSGVLSRLRAAGEVTRCPDRGWVLHGRPPLPGTCEDEPAVLAA